MSSPNPEASSSLEDQRDFLLRSLDDLDREHEVGDIDDHDYAALKDDYTARAAAVLRAIEAGRRPPRPTPRRPPGRRVAAWLAVAGFAVLAGVLVAQASGRREAGEFGSGGVRQSITETLNEAGRRFSEGDATAAIALYEEVLDAEPTNAEALTYRGWALYTLVRDQEAALSSLLEAATANPEYPDVHAFLAVVFFRNGLVEQASRELDRLEALDPPPDILQLTEGLREEIERALAAAGSTTTAPPP